ncbi:hypothetical protein GCM10023080_083780 [Streptomyces pseudoechinosporeus]
MLSLGQDGAVETHTLPWPVQVVRAQAGPGKQYMVLPELRKPAVICYSLDELVALPDAASAGSEEGTEATEE